MNDLTITLKINGLDWEQAVRDAGQAATAMASFRQALAGVGVGSVAAALGRFPGLEELARREMEQELARLGGHYGPIHVLCAEEALSRLVNWRRLRPGNIMRRKLARLRDGPAQH
jgi:hypothetical protein